MYLNYSFLNLYFSNFFNGKTPTNTTWTTEYNDGYIYWCGNFSTFGTWTTMYYGCNEYIQIGQYICLRSGGDNGIWKGQGNGEYIHHKCGDYTSSYNSITSNVDWNLNRISWIKLKKNLFQTKNKMITNLKVYIFLFKILIIFFFSFFFFFFLKNFYEFNK